MAVFVWVMRNAVLLGELSFVEKHGLLRQFRIKMYTEEWSSVFDQRDGIPVEDSWCRKRVDYSLSPCS